jgi:predicted glycosyl hydrolase (DUF1957 family)
VEIAFLLHLYQPSTQSESTFRDIANSCYLPLIKLLKQRKTFKVTLSIPLSLLEQMEKYGYSSWIADVKELVEADRIEVTGGAAYHCLLTRVPQDLFDKQIILNEYGLGYYLGRRTGFEGEKSVMIKNMDGFFPPELAVSTNVIKNIADYNYKWVVADETAVLGNLPRDGIYKLADTDLRVIVRNRKLSNYISFKRDPDVSDVVSQINHSCVLCMDGEVFGHHYEEGIYLFEAISDGIAKKDGRLVTVSEYLKDIEEKKLEKLVESSWGSTDEEARAGNVYPLWHEKNNEVQGLQWELFEYVCGLKNVDTGYSLVEDFENVAIWKNDVLQKLEDKNLARALMFDLLLCKVTQSDQFWWTSKKELTTGEILDDPVMASKAVDLYTDLAQLLDDDKAKEKIGELVEKIKSLLNPV